MEKVTSIEFEEIPDTEELEMQKCWVKNVEKILLSYRDYTPNKETITQFLTSKEDFEIYEFYSYNLAMDAMQYFQAGVTQKDRSLSANYFSIIRKIYMMSPEIGKQKFQKAFIKEWQHHAIDYTPYFESLISGFSETLKELIEKCINNVENIEGHVKEEIRWLMLISPVTVLTRLFRWATEFPMLLPFILQTCRSIPALFYDRPLKIWHNHLETDKIEPLLAVAFRRFIVNCRSVETPDNEWDFIEILGMALCTGECPLMSCWILLDVVLCELYTNNRIPTKSVEILTGLASRLVSDQNMQKLTWKFATSIREQPQDCVYMTPTIIVVLCNLIQEYFDNGMSDEVVDNAKEILKGIGERMDLRFDEETKNYLINDVLRKYPWYMEFAISTWFCSLNVENRRVPSVIYNAIYPDERVRSNMNEEDVLDIEKIETIDEEDSGILSENPSHAFLRALTELGLFDVACAIEILQKLVSSSYITISFESTEELNLLMESVLKENFKKKIGLQGMQAEEDATVLVMQVVENFGPSLTQQDGEHIAKTMVDMIAAPVYRQESPRWTHDISQSVSIPALAPPLKPNSENWPPVDNKFVKVEMRNIRREQKKQRDRTLKAAVEKSRAFLQQYRDKWANSGITSWSCPKSPPNEPVFMTSSNRSTCPQKRILTMPEQHFFLPADFMNDADTEHLKVPRLGGSAKRGGRR